MAESPSIPAVTKAPKTPKAPRAILVAVLLWCLRHWRLLSICGTVILVMVLWTKEKNAIQQVSQLQGRAQALQRELSDATTKEKQSSGDALVLRMQLDNVTLDRNVRVKQLSLLTAIANQQYPNAPEAKRLDLLIRDMAIAALSTNDLIPPQALQHIKSKLDFADRVSVHIYVASSAKVPVRLAGIIAQTFRECGYKVTGPDTLENTPAQGVAITAKKEPKGLLNEALGMFFKELGQDPDLKTGKGLSDDDLEIVVGEKAPAKG